MRWVLLGSISLAASVAGAQTVADRDAVHTAVPEDIIVTAPYARSRDDVLSSVGVLTGVELTRDLRATIGETLARQPGVSATSFGPNASRPILRGFQGERVRILADGIGSFDVSNTSVDHAVVVNPLFANRIEILRGPASLLFGSSAIGGVVNVIDARIPRAVPAEPLHVDTIASFGSAANERSIAASVDLPVGPTFVLHLDGSYNKSDDLEIGGFALSDSERATARTSATAALALGDADRATELTRIANLRDRLPNSAARTYTVGGGGSVITETGNFGLVVSHYDSLYGVPERFSLDPVEPGEGAIRLDVKQTRVDARAEYELGGDLIDTIKVRAGYADYEHAELLADNSVGTLFANKSGEGRLEFAQTARGSWRGAFGAQVLVRDFAAIGDESFVPRNDTVQAGLFVLQQVETGPILLEAGARIEHSDIQSDDVGFDRNFTSFSASLGAGLTLTDGWKVGLNLSRTERAPAAEELLADGPHGGTQAFEMGDPSFAKEASIGIEATLRGKMDGFTFEAAAYANRFSNYIYEVRTGAIEDDLPVFQFRQDKARYYGFEAHMTAELAKIGDFSIKAEALADYVHARIPGVGPVPRIPPLRLLGALSASSDRIDAEVEVEHATRQSRVAAFETPTAAYTQVNASLSFRPFSATPDARIILSANNIFNTTPRRHASFLKDVAPLTGRDFRATVRLTF